MRKIEAFHGANVKDYGGFNGLVLMRRGYLILTLLFVGACGSPPAEDASATAAGAGAGEFVEIIGTLAESGQPADKLLVFAYTDLPAGAPPQGAEPASIAAVGMDRSFLLGDIPRGTVTVAFLLDTSNDGAIDAGDKFAVLADPEQKLAGLEAGDRALVNQVVIDANRRQALAKSIDIRRVSGAEPTQAPAE